MGGMFSTPVIFRKKAPVKAVPRSVMPGRKYAPYHAPIVPALSQPEVAERIQEQMQEALRKTAPVKPNYGEGALLLGLALSPIVLKIVAEVMKW